MARQRIWGADRRVVYLPVATETLSDLDGSREKEIRRAAKKFISAPESAADKRPADYVWHIRDLGTKTRAFGTWCQNEAIEAEVFIVLEVYKKENEEPYWDDLAVYNEDGQRYDETFNSISEGEFSDWLGQIEQRVGIEVVDDD